MKYDTKITNKKLLNARSFMSALPSLIHVAPQRLRRIERQLNNYISTRMISQVKYEEEK
jgi:hypothetical protein